MFFPTRISSIGYVASKFGFALLSVLSAWYLYQTRSAGWYLGLATVVNWFIMVSLKVVGLNGFGIIVSIGMVAVLFWLARPAVRTH